jgi:hypothetical protein
MPASLPRILISLRWRLPFTLSQDIVDATAADVTDLDDHEDRQMPVIVWRGSSC